MVVAVPAMLCDRMRAFGFDFAERFCFGVFGTAESVLASAALVCEVCDVDVVLSAAVAAAGVADDVVGAADALGIAAAVDAVPSGGEGCLLSLSVAVCCCTCCCCCCPFSDCAFPVRVPVRVRPLPLPFPFPFPLPLAFRLTLSGFDSSWSSAFGAKPGANTYDDDAGVDDDAV